MVCLDGVDVCLCGDGDDDDDQCYGRKIHKYKRLMFDQGVSVSLLEGLNNFSVSGCRWFTRRLCRKVKPKHKSMLED